MVEIEIGHCYYWILKQSRHDFFHDYYWILNSQDMIRILNGQDMISQVNIYVMGIVWILCNPYVWRSKFNRGSYSFVKNLLHKFV